MGRPPAVVIVVRYVLRRLGMLDVARTHSYTDMVLGWTLQTRNGILLLQHHTILLLPTAVGGSPKPWVRKSPA